MLSQPHTRSCHAPPTTPDGHHTPRVAVTGSEVYPRTHVRRDEGVRHGQQTARGGSRPGRPARDGRPALRRGPPRRRPRPARLPRADGTGPHGPHPPQGQPEGRLRLPRLRLARGRRAAHRGVLRERRQGRRRGGHAAPGHPGVLRRAPAVRPRRPQRLLAGPAGPHHPPGVPAGGRRPLRADRLGAGVLDHRGGTRRAGLPDEALFYTSGRTSNEAAFLLQLFAREYGTNNLPDCSNMCHESSGSALTETIGVGKGSVSSTTSTGPT